MNRDDFLNSQAQWAEARIVGFNPAYLPVTPFTDYGIVGAIRRFGSPIIGNLYPREYLAWCEDVR